MLRCSFRSDLPWGPKGSVALYEESKFDKGCFYMHFDGNYEQRFIVPKASFDQFFEDCVVRYKPKLSDPFWIVLPDGGVIGKTWKDEVIDGKYYSFGNCFRTMSDATSAAIKLQEAAYSFHASKSREYA